MIVGSGKANRSDISCTRSIVLNIAVSQIIDALNASNTRLSLWALCCEYLIFQFSSKFLIYREIFLRPRYTKKYEFYIWIRFRVSSMDWIHVPMPFIRTLRAYVENSVGISYSIWSKARPSINFTIFCLGFWIISVVCYTRLAQQHQQCSQKLCFHFEDGSWSSQELA